MDITSFDVNGLKVCLCGTEKFNSTSVCLVYRTELKRENVSPYALLPKILSRASSRHSSLRSVNAYLEEMGGAKFIAQPIKKGNEQIIAFYITAPKEYSGRLFEFLSDTIYRPLLSDGGFMPSFVHSACSVAAKEIADKINNKKSYAAEKMIELMCKDETFGICSDGYIEDFGDISGRGLYDAYSRLLTEGIAEMYIAGDISQNEAQSYISNCFDTFAKGNPISQDNSRNSPQPPKYYTESAETAQSVLTIGIRTDKADYAKLKLCNEILGGSASSRLFKKIREKNSLCYYINSSLFRYKGIISVQAGIESSAAEKVVDAVNEEINSLAKRGAPKKELELAKDNLLSAYKTIEDYPQRLLDYMLSLSVAGKEYSLTNEAEAIRNTEDIGGALEGAYADTIYLLKEGGK